MLTRTYYCFEKLLELIKTLEASLLLAITNICPTIPSTSVLNMQYLILRSLCNLMTCNLLFNITMQSNVVATMDAPFHANPLIQLWRILEASWILWHSFLEFFKLAKIAVMQMLGLVENEQTFFIHSFMKCKLGNHFNEHLNDVVGMYFKH